MQRCDLITKEISVYHEQTMYLSPWYL